ncbi:MAG: DUF190 domain-containing protein [Bacteroidetes bacterium]|nr:DUF190 domain-containing protein [Bacteroidota bacterium]
MLQTGDAQLLRIFIGESDTLHHHPLWETILNQARAAHLAGCTVFRGEAGFGASSKIHKAGILDLSTDLPVLIEIVDHPDRIQSFLPQLDSLMEEAGSHGLVTVEKVDVRFYR